MYKLALTIICAAAAGIAYGQQRNIVNIVPGTPEGQMLQQIGETGDEAGKIKAGEEFLAKYPGSQNVPWVLGVLQPLYLKTKQFDKALDAGEKLLAADPDDAEIGHHTLQAAEGTKDPALIIKWSNRTSEIARRVASKPKPTAEDQVPNWAASVDYASQLDIYTEYSLYRALLENPDPKQKIALGEALEKRNPNSRYIGQMAEQWILAYQQTGDRGKAASVAETVAAKDPSNETVLAAAADGAYNAKAYDKAIDYGDKLLSLMSAKTKPEGMSDSDWDKKKRLMTGLGNWYAGMSYAAESKWPQADKSLRAAIPLLHDNAQLLTAALFHAGLANHNMKNMSEAAGFFERCAGIKSPYQAQAQKNLKAIRGK